MSNVQNDSRNETPRATVQNVSDSDFASTVIDSDRPVLVDFWAEWCGPCRALGPTIDELASDYEPQLAVVKVNVDDSPQTAAKYGVRSIPTIMLFRDGKPTETAVGARPKAQLAELIDRNLDRPV